MQQQNKENVQRDITGKNFTMNNTLKLYEIFGMYQIFPRKLMEYEITYKIHDSKEIDWNEVSAMPKLPEFIMEEFSDKLNWVIILFNRKMMKRTINKFRKQLSDVTKTNNFIEKLTDNKYLVIDTILNVNKSLFNDIFYNACEKGHDTVVGVLIKDTIIVDVHINHGSLLAHQNGHHNIVKVLRNR